ncbi:hypothetical protein CF327_g5023 [Tilletia walkeri]|uniref:Uncharacterized protein n=1 Tax=Tilletia walkeri TaxID=117179 RepID=A0A8X7T4Q0_9BASI|nr:hypothetical protein CF327_g5023 [Tilletia walkeri]KAE8268676.1 hypothetical protein A4X09_0g3665 [Tilletia walkeri]
MRVLQIQGLMLLVSCVLVAGLPVTKNGDVQVLARDINRNTPAQSSPQLERTDDAVVPRFIIDPDTGGAPEQHVTPAHGTSRKPPRSFQEDLAKRAKFHFGNAFGFSPNGYATGPGKRN